jgi:hypothetical protein
MRLAFSISWTSGLLARSAAAAPGASGPQQLRQLADAADDGARLFGERLGLVQHHLAFERLAKVSWNLPSRMRSPSLSGASTTGTPLTWVPFFDLRSTMRTPSSSATRSWRACGDAEVLQHDLAFGRAPDHHLAVRERVSRLRL